MATYPQQNRAQQPPDPLHWGERWRRRIRNNLRQIVARGDLTILSIVWMLVAMPVLSFAAADWAEGILSLLAVVFFSVLFGYLLGWSRLSELMALIVSTLYGVLIAGGTVILFNAEGGNLLQRSADFMLRLSDWVQVVSNGGISDDNLIFIFFMAVLFWFVGYSTAWHVFRIDRVWRAILPPGVMLLFNTFSYNEDAPLEIYVIIFVFLALLLIVRSHVDAREYEWYRRQVRYSRNVRQYFLRVGAIMALVVVLLAWVIPAGEDGQNQDRFDEFLNSISRITEIWDRLFAGLESQGVASPEYYGGDRLELSGAIQLGEDPVLEVAAPSQYRWYWRSTVLDVYLNGAWEHNRSVRATKDSEGLLLNVGQNEYQGRQTVTQDIQVLMPATSLIYAAPQPVEFGVPVKVELDCVTAPDNFECVNQNLLVDPSVVRTVDPLREGDEYEIASSLSVATAFELREASTDYPAWVTARYLQYQERISPQLNQLSLEIVAQAGALNPYDKAKAIERWLRTNIAYDENIPEPPVDQDPVDWVVFTYKRGYCNYYASAMILMLRSQGIPARLAAGFSQGEYQADSGTYLVRERDAHTWVEAFFPGYGWVEFEPTANEEPLDREGDLPPDIPPPSELAQEPSATPTPPPTNTPPPPPPPAETATQTPTQTPQVTQQFTPPTPTPSPSLTPTPVPPPEDMEVEDDGDSNNLLELLLFFFLILLVVVVLFALSVLFVVWWVEHRGLGGLSLVEKAYARLAIYGRWLGIRLPEEYTPHERQNTLVRNVPEGEEPISDITELYMRKRFAPPADGSDDELAGLAWGRARLAFIRRKFQRWLGSGG